MEFAADYELEAIMDAMNIFTNYSQDKVAIMLIWFQTLLVLLPPIILIAELAIEEVSYNIKHFLDPFRGPRIRHA